MVLSSDPSVDLNEITPTSLTHGFGIQVCNVLNALSNAAIEKISSELSKASNNRIYPTAIDDPIDVDSDDDKDNIEEVSKFLHPFLPFSQSVTIRTPLGYFGFHEQKWK